MKKCLFLQYLKMHPPQKIPKIFNQSATTSSYEDSGTSQKFSFSHLPANCSIAGNSYPKLCQYLAEKGFVVFFFKTLGWRHTVWPKAGNECAIGVSEHKVQKQSHREAKAASNFPCCQVGVFPGMDKLQKHTWVSVSKLVDLLWDILRSEPVYPPHR